MNRGKECIFDYQIAGRKGCGFSRLRIKIGQGTSGARHIRAVFMNGATAEGGGLGNVPGSNGVALGNAKLGLTSPDKFAVTIVQPHAHAQIGLQSHQVGVAVSIDVQREHAENCFAQTETQGLAFSR